MFVPLILVVVGLFKLRGSLANGMRQARTDGRGISVLQNIGHKTAWLSLLAACGILLLVTANLFRPHFADAEIISRIGHYTDAKIINTKTYSEVNDPELTVRYEIMYKTSAGELIETYFYSSDHNFYPPVESINFAQPGETFQIAYLPNFPTTFVVLTDADSPSKTRAKCSDLGLELNKATSRRDFEPDNEQYKQKLADAAKRFADAGCKLTIAFQNLSFIPPLIIRPSVCI